MNTKKFYNSYFTLWGIFILLCIVGFYHSQKFVFFNAFDDFGADFFNVCRYICDRDPYNNIINGLAQKPYLALSYVLIYPFTLLYDYHVSLNDCWNNSVPMISFAVFTFACFAFWLVSAYLLVRKYATNVLAMVVAVTSSIFLFSIERGNLVFISAACLNFFLYYEDRDELKYRILAIIFLSIATVLKIYPGVFILLWFRKGKIKDVVLFAFAVVTLVLLPFLFFKGGFDNIELWIRNVRLQAELYSDMAYPYGMGLITPLNIALNVISFFGTLVIPAKVLSGLLCLISMFLLFCTDKKSHKILLLSCIVTVFPVSSMVYYFMYIFPMMFYMLGKGDREMKKERSAILVLLLIVIQPIQIVPIKAFTISYQIANIAAILIWLYGVFIVSQDVILKTKDK